MRFALHDLSPEQFEKLVTAICHELLGPGIQEFAAGRDGGRDAKFVGTAQCFPSATEPLSGQTIVQAKHTTEPVGKFSDSDFSGSSTSSTLAIESPRIVALRKAGLLDNYLLFANRRLGGIANESITHRVKTETGVPIVHLFGVEAMERHIKRHPHISKMLADFEYDLPLRASPDELAHVIANIADKSSDIDWPKSRSLTSLERVAFERKNQLNGLSDEYAAHITRNYLKHFEPVEKFLADPINTDVFRAYSDAVDEFSAKLVAHRSEYATFDKLLNHLLEVLIQRDSDLRANKRLTRVVFYLMYWACDIGANPE